MNKFLIYFREPEHPHFFKTPDRLTLVSDILRFLSGIMAVRGFQKTCFCSLFILRESVQGI